MNLHFPCSAMNFLPTFACPKRKISSIEITESVKKTLFSVRALCKSVTIKYLLVATSVKCEIRKIQLNEEQESIIGK